MEGSGWESLPIHSTNQVLPVEAGLIPRCVHSIFTHLLSLPADNFTVKCSFLEIYNEELVDLLSPGKAQVPTMLPNSIKCNIFLCIRLFA